MSRLDAFLSALLLVVATFFFTEWLHYRLDAPPLFQVLLGPRGGEEGAGAGARDPDSVTESEFQTYLRVLEAMQANRSLSIEDAVGAERMPLERFRDLEQRVQRNDGLIDRARHILREKAETLWKSVGAPLEHG
jgi:hypothetical protein